MSRIVTVNFEVPRSRTASWGRAAIRGILRRAARAALHAEGVRDAEIEITLLDDLAITALNREYLDHDYPTDVISFPLHAEGERPLGDLYIGWDQALRQARDLGEEPTIEMMRLAIHGTLHILGYDHPEGDGRTKGTMWKRQEEILQKLVGIEG